MVRATAVVFAVLLLYACNPGIQSRLATDKDIVYMPRPARVPGQVSPCSNPLSYTEHPELLRPKYVRVNLHYMNSTDGRYNMPREETYQYASEHIRMANDMLAANQPMQLPLGNNTPVIPIPWRYVITSDPSEPDDKGVYYHVDDELCYAVKTGRERNISDKRMIQKYAVRSDAVLNIFIQTHHLDSIASPTYKPDASGISLGSSVKIFGKWHERPHPWGARAITNHEIGHSLGLAHTWSGYDGCDDTPPHSNCWNYTDNPPCDTEVSNNMMDYNNRMDALTPCQIGKVLLNMTRLNAMQRNILEPRWCTLDTTANITIQDSVSWNCNADVEGHILIERTGHLVIACRVSMPEGARIKIEPGGKLTILSTGILHNACGGQWEGIELVQAKKLTGSVMVEEGGKIENAVSLSNTKS